VGQWKRIQLSNTIHFAIASAKVKGSIWFWDKVSRRDWSKYSAIGLMGRLLSQYNPVSSQDVI